MALLVLMEDHHLAGIKPEPLAWLGQESPFAFDKVARGMVAFFVALDHREFLGHVEGVVVLDTPTSIPAFRIWKAGNSNA